MTVFFLKILHELTHHRVEEVGLESTGPYGEPISHFLYTQGIKVYIINPYRIKSFREMKVRKTSTDKRNSILIAQYMGLGKEKHPYTPHSPLQSLTRLRFSLVDTLVAHKNELRSAVAMTFPGFFDLFGNNYNKTSLALLEYYSTKVCEVRVDSPREGISISGEHFGWLLRDVYIIVRDSGFISRKNLSNTGFAERQLELF